MPASKFESAAAGKPSAPKARTSRKTKPWAAEGRVLPEAAAKNTIDPTTGQVTPLALFYNAIRFWWLLFVFIVLGGLVGWLVSFTRPPVYEAVARFSGSIDYTSTGPLTQYEEDTAYDAIGNILTSASVMQAVVDEAAAQGYSMELPDLIRMTHRERRFDVWELRILHADRQMAQRIASIWVDQGNAALQESYRHALLADQLRRNIRLLENCLGKSAQGVVTSQVCNPSRFSEIQEDLEAAGNALHQEQTASQGLFVGLIPGPREPVTLSDQPIRNGRNQFVLAGSLIGLLLALVIIESGLPARLRR